MSGATAVAFMRAFREHQELDNEPRDNTYTPEYQFSLYAFEGAKERAVVGMIEDHDEAAIAALVAFDKLQLILDGGFTVGGGPLDDEDEQTQIRAVQSAFRVLWRYHDRKGGTLARPNAKCVGTAERFDTVSWEAER